MKRLKRIMALVIAMAMVLSMSAMTTFAAPNYAEETNFDTTWSGTADPSLSISGLEAADVVTFYQVFEYSQDASTAVADIDTSVGSTFDVTKGAGGWKVVDKFSTAITPADFKAILTTGITADIAAKIAKAATGTGHDETVATGQTSVTWAEEKTGDEVTKPAPNAGLYVAIIAPGKAGVMYNPIFVASDYYKSEPSDKSSTWEAVENPLSYAGKSMAKKTTVTVGKTANDANTVDTSGTKPADAAAGVVDYDPNSETVNVGDTVSFTVETKIPEFGDNYVNASYSVTDTLSTGLQLLNAAKNDAATDTDYSVKVEIKKAAATASDTAETGYTEITKDTTFSYIDANGAAQSGKAFTITASATGYTITFDKYYLLTQIDAITDLKITYSAKVKDEAATKSVNEEDNTVVVSFNNNPNDANSKTKLIDKTNHYTFDIDADIFGQTEGSWKTTEVVKVGLDEDGNEITNTSTTLHPGQTKVGALEGAKFKLYVADTEGSDIKDEAGATIKASVYTNSLLTNEDYIVSDSTGRLNIYDVSESKALTGIRGLDAGTYYLVETDAPAGYIKAQNAVKVEIIPTFKEVEEEIDDDNNTATPALKVTVKELDSYVVKINNKATANYTITNESDGSLETVTQGDTITGADSAGFIKTGDTGDSASTFGKITNTRGTELPSTGGVGTTIFYIVGTMLVLGAGVILITRRRMDA